MRGCSGSLETKAGIQEAYIQHSPCEGRSDTRAYGTLPIHSELLAFLNSKKLCLGTAPMDPWVAFGVAGTILQFIDSDSIFIGLAWRLYRPGPDSSEDLPELLSLAERLDDVLGTLKSPSRNTSPCKDEQNSLAQLADQCARVGDRLLLLLRKLHLPETSRKRDSLKAAFRSM